MKVVRFFIPLLVLPILALGCQGPSSSPSGASPVDKDLVKGPGGSGK